MVLPRFPLDNEGRVAHTKTVYCVRNGGWGRSWGITNDDAKPLLLMTADLLMTAVGFPIAPYSAAETLFETDRPAIKSAAIGSGTYGHGMVFPDYQQLGINDINSYQNVQYLARKTSHVLSSLHDTACQHDAALPSSSRPGRRGSADISNVVTVHQQWPQAVPRCLFQSS